MNIIVIKELNNLAYKLGIVKKIKKHRVYFQSTVSDSFKCGVCKAKLDYDYCIKIGKLTHCNKPLKHIRGFRLL